MDNKISDFVIRLKNASLVRRRRVFVPYCNINKKLGKLLVKEGYLESVEESQVSGKKVLEAALKYKRRNPVITDVKVVSKPSLHVSATLAKIPEIQRRGRHTVVLSTNKGIMSAKEALKKKVGGEVLFEIW